MDQKRGLSCPVRLLEIDELDIENKGGIGRNDASSASRSVGMVGRADQVGSLALAHLGNTLVPEWPEHAALYATLRTRFGK